MLSQLTKQYLEKLEALKQTNNSSSYQIGDHESFDGEISTTSASEYSVELGPLKVKVTKTKTVVDKRNLQKNGTQSLNKGEIISIAENGKETPVLHQEFTPTPANNGLAKRINIII